MAERPDPESKTEEPTERKIREAVEKGHVPFSREASTLASLVALLLVASFLVTESALRLKVSLERFIDDPGGWSLENAADANLLFRSIGLDAMRLLVPVIAVLAVAGIAASLLQNPPQLVLDRIKPDWSRVSPGSGWRRIFGVQGHVEFLKSFFKMGAVGLVGALLLWSTQYDIFNSMFAEPAAIPELIRVISVRLVAAITLAAVVLVAADVVWSQVSWHRELRMTRQELKDELKQMEGDPIVKARLRSLARDRSRRRMIAAVPRATLVIANPTHYSVALRYLREEGGAPLVVAKGQDLIALKIRQVAEEHGIPVVEDKLLARSLYESVEVDRLIPPQFYRAVAEIIIFLMARKGGSPARRITG